MAAEPMPERRGGAGLHPGLGNVLFDVWLVSRATTALLDEALRPVGLAADEFAVYSVLAAGDSMTPTELARWMSAPPTTVSSTIKRLEGRGHVRRVPDPDDGRSYRLALTAAGRKVHQAAGQRFGPLLEAVTQHLGAHAGAVERALGALHDAVEVIRRAERPA